MSSDSALVNRKGVEVEVPALRVGDRTIIVCGRWIKVAAVYDEEWNEVEPIRNAAEYVSALRSWKLRPDIFTYSQEETQTQDCFGGRVEFDNLAVAPTTDFAAWWEGLPQETRKNVRRAERRGLMVRAVEFDEQLVRGIKEVYDETPVRQGRRFWHYGKDLETVRRENSSYLARSQFIGAFCQQELVGFLKMVSVGSSARIMQILSKNCHADKRPMNALLAKAVEICSARQMARLIYGQYIYDNKADSPVTEFKRRNGFEQLLVPRRYLPLGWKGKAALAFGLHRGLKSYLPEPVLSALLAMRQLAYRQTLARSRPISLAKPGSLT